jgi:hypothetical protein
MPTNPETDELLKYAADLAQATTEGKLAWQRANPTTFSWTKSQPGRPPEGRITLQYVAGQERRPLSNGGITLVNVKKYIFTAIDNANVQRFTIDSSQNPELHIMLHGLFHAIETSLARKGLDFLKSILPH